MTAASAIEALQEASTKRARMATEQLHEAFRKAVRLEIETEREFNFFLRPVTIAEGGEQKEVLFDSTLMNRDVPGGVQLPIEFSISIKAVRQNRYAVQAQNELMLRLYDLGALDVAQAIGLMEFEGKEQVLKSLQAGEAAAAPQTQSEKKEKKHAVSKTQR